MFAFIVRLFHIPPTKKKMWGIYAAHTDTDTQINMQTHLYIFIYYSLTIYDFQQNMQISAYKFRTVVFI